VLDLFDYVFPENGLLAFKGGKPIGSTVRGLPWVGWMEVWAKKCQSPQAAARAYPPPPTHVHPCPQ
jgi:hypothetical protein